MLETLETLLQRAKALRKQVRAYQPKQVGRNELREEAKSLGSVWFTDVLPQLSQKLPDDLTKKYSEAFTRLIRLSSPNNRTVSYLEALESIIKPFSNDFILPAQQGKLGGSHPSEFDNFLSSISDNAESEYMGEAIACAKGGYLRAAVVLGWSAAIDRIHRKIEEIGFDKFNAMSASMTAQTAGRYKKFTKKQAVADMSDMREVFDNIILWVIDGMGMIDSNQATRLRACFDMRCHGAHPGDAPITTYNLLSFFSDLEQIVFRNPKFSLAATPQGAAPSSV